MGLVILSTSVCAGLGLLISLVTLGKVNAIALKPLPTLVQTINGQPMQIAALEGQERSPQLIKQFTVNTLTNLFTWRQRLLPTNAEEQRNPKLDPGIPIEVDGNNNTKIPTAVWMASFALADRFRQDFLAKELAPLITDLKVLQGSAELALIPVHIQEPEAVKGESGEKLWKVRVVANLVVKTAPEVPEKLVPFNKVIYIRSVVPPAINRESVAVAPDRDLNLVIAKARPGLEIYAFHDFENQDLIPTTPTPIPTPVH